MTSFTRILCHSLVAVSLLGLGPLAVHAQLLPDRDADGMPDATDNCPYHANPGQADVDRSSRGDLCECGDQTGDGRVDVPALGAAVEGPSPAPMPERREPATASSTTSGTASIASCVRVSVITHEASPASCHECVPPSCRKCDGVAKHTSRLLAAATLRRSRGRS